MADFLVWQIIKKNNCKAVKRTHPLNLMTTEKGSLRSQRTCADSGFACKEAIDISLDDDGMPVLSIRNTRSNYARSPDHMWRRIGLRGGIRKAVTKANNSLGPWVKPAVKAAAIAKISAYYQAMHRKNRGIDHTTLLVAQ